MIKKILIVLLVIFLIQVESAKFHFLKQLKNKFKTSSEKIESIPRNNYPIRFSYVDGITEWWPPEKIAAGLAVPGYAEESIYNYVALAFWFCGGPAKDAALVWSDAIKYFSDDNPFGQTTKQIQQTLKKKYNEAGVKIMVSAFGATQFPTSQNLDPEMCAESLGDFVLQNHLDGADIDWQDNDAMEKGVGEEWLITFTKKLREKIPNHIITFAPQAPYFKKEYYKNGGFMTVHEAVGSLVNFYNIQFYNQGDTKYQTYEELFEQAREGKFNGTAVKEIVKRGVPVDKLVVGKPATPKDAQNTGYIPSQELGAYAVLAYQTMHWYAGYMFWQFSSDKDGYSILTAAGFLKEICALNKDCK